MSQKSVMTDQLSDASDSELDVSVRSVIRKRKQDVISPVGNSDSPLKRHNSLPDISHTPLVPKTKKRAPSTKTQAKLTPKPATAPFRSMLLGTFQDKAFQEGISPMISQSVSPMIESAIQRAVDTAITAVRNDVIKPLLDSNSKLTSIVNEQKNLIKQHESRIVELESEYDVVCSELDDLKLSVNDLEQYGRRNNLRISNMSLDQPGATEREITENTVKFLNENVLKISGTTQTPMTADDIDRCHTIGPMRGGRNNIIVKFHKYNTKRLVYQAKTNLKGDTQKRFINEDLTKHNYGLIQTMTRHKRAGFIAGFWTRDGNVYAKKNIDDRPRKIKTAKDIDDLIDRTTRPARPVSRRVSDTSVKEIVT